ncbi:ATP-dependent RNA helicase vasa [Pseudolycoriella hygida]|uniref:RNA helicase n=1 Tax=Pseudolycoriella hygida TaxID=35572 RepID=A0A9Q0S5X2_9DIPT|nr:ATP-dependent RNA helicase vasa [Pseudolycoriella hygida]
MQVRFCIMFVKIVLILITIAGLGSSSDVLKHVYINRILLKTNPEYCPKQTSKLEFITRDVKSYSFSCNLTKTVDEPFLHVILNYRYRNGYQKFLIDTVIDVCAYFNKTTGSALVDLVKGELENYSTNMFHTCPYEGEVSLNKMPLTGALFQYIFLPAGEYKLVINGTTGEKEIFVFKITGYFSVAAGRTLFIESSTIASDPCPPKEVGHLMSLANTGIGNNSRNNNNFADSGGNLHFGRGGGGRSFGIDGRDNSFRKNVNYSNGSNGTNGMDSGFDQDASHERSGRSFGRRSKSRDGKELSDEVYLGDDKTKEFYIPPEPSMDEQEIFRNGITSGINFSKYDQIPVRVNGDNPPNPIMNFNSSGLTQLLLSNVEKCGYTEPTPIQKTAIPVVMANRDLMGCAQTGSGKTAAFILPILHCLLTSERDLVVGKPHVVIISPTRELTSQIYKEVHKFGYGSFLRYAIVYGGTATRHQSSNLLKGCHVLVATPGRLLDFVNKGFITFEDVRFMVLDEADRMLDMGFMSAIEEILNHRTMRPMVFIFQ